MAPLMGAHHLMRPGRRPGRARLRRARRARAPASSSSAPAWPAWRPPPWRSGMHSDVYVLDRNLDRLRQVDHHFRGRARDRGLVRSTPSRRSASRPTSSSGPCSSWGPGPRGWCPTRWSSRCGRARCWSTSRSTRAAASSRPARRRTRNPTFEVHGSIFYCVANMPGAVPHTSTHALANATLPYTLDIADQGWREAVRADPALAEGRQRGRGPGRLRAGGRGPRPGLHAARRAARSTDSAELRCPPPRRTRPSRPG